MQTQAQLHTEYFILLTTVAVIYFVGRWEHGRQSKESEKKRVHGQYIPEWVAMGFALPGIVLLTRGITIFNGIPGAFGLCMFGLLCGLAIGWIHGLIRLYQLRLDKRARKPHRSAKRSDDGNPYRPPNNQ